MSHTTRIESELKDKQILIDTMSELSIDLKVGHHTIDLFSEKVHVEYSFSLPGWRYRIGVTNTGQILFDNYNGVWGNITELNKVIDTYSKNYIIHELNIRGMSVTTEIAEDGTIVVEGVDYQ